MLNNLEEAIKNTELVLDTLDRNALVVVIKNLVLRTKQAEEIAHASISETLLKEVIEKHIVERSITKAELFHTIILNAIKALEDLAKSPNTKSVNRIVDSLKLVIGADSLSIEDTKANTFDKP